VSVPRPDFERLINDARTNRVSVPMDLTRQILGDLFRDSDLAQETVMIRNGSDISLTPTTWIRVVRRAQTRAVAAPEATSSPQSG
jgi:hypothetical protein